jgi:hypothetical protein
MEIVWWHTLEAFILLSTVKTVWHSTLYTFSSIGILKSALGYYVYALAVAHEVVILTELAAECG